MARLVFDFEQEGLAEGGQGREVISPAEPVEGLGPVVGDSAVMRVVRDKKQISG